MSSTRVIRIQEVEIDLLDARAEGTAIFRAANGVLTRRRLSVPAHPMWTHGDALRALTLQSQTIAA